MKRNKLPTFVSRKLWLAPRHFEIVQVPSSVGVSKSEKSQKRVAKGPKIEGSDKMPPCNLGQILEAQAAARRTVILVL